MIASAVDHTRRMLAVQLMRHNLTWIRTALSDVTRSARPATGFRMLEILSDQLTGHSNAKLDPGVKDVQTIEDHCVSVIAYVSFAEHGRTNHAYIAESERSHE